MGGSDCASPCSVRRGRRPHGTPRNFMHENRETSEAPAADDAAFAFSEILSAVEIKRQFDEQRMCAIR